MINKKSRGIYIADYVGTWYVIDSKRDVYYGEIYLLEHEEYGDEAACLIVDRDGTVLLDDVWNGFEDWKENRNM